MSTLKITCRSCYYFNLYENTCSHISAKTGDLSQICLKRIEPILQNKTPHPLYPELEKLHNIHEYVYWKPKEEYDYDPIYKFLNKEDFEI
jgi:hypothetical protein